MELIAVILLVLLVLFGEVGLYRRRGLEGLSYYCHFSETERTEGESLQFVETVTNDKTLPVPPVTRMCFFIVRKKQKLALRPKADAK